MVNGKRRMKVFENKVKTVQKRKTECDNAIRHVEKENRDSYGLSNLSGVRPFENVTDVLNDLKLREHKCDIPIVTFDYYLQLFKSLISKQAGNISRNDGLALLEFANKFLLFCSKRTDNAIDEESLETILQGIKNMLPKLWSNTKEEKEKYNGSKHSKRFKLCQDEISKIDSEFVMFYDSLFNLVERNAISEFGIHEILSSAFIILSSVGGTETMYLKVIKMVSIVFMKCEYVRVSIMDDIFLIIIKDLSTNQKSQLSIDGNQILVLTALVMSIFQNMPPPRGVIEGGSARGKNKSKSNTKISSSSVKNQDDTYKNYLALSQNFTANFFLKCCKSEEKNGVDLFERFLDDIIIMTDHVKWPSSYLLLMTLYQVMMKILTCKTKETNLRITSFHCIGKIYKHLSSCMYSSKISGDVSESSIDSLQTYRMMILGWLTMQSNDNKNVCNFYLTQWKHVDLLLNKSPIEGSIVSTGQVLKNLSHDVNNLKPGVLKEMYRFLSSKTWCSKVHSTLTIYLFQLASDDSVAIRLKAIQYLSHLVTLNFNMIKQETFVNVLQRRVTDSSASVRSSVVELIGRILNKREDSFDTFFQDLFSSCMDVSVGVRKQAVVSLKDFLLNHPKHPLVPEIMSCLLSRNFDEYVKKHVQDTFRSFFTENDVACVCDCMVRMITKFPSQATLSLVESCFSSLIAMETKTSGKTSIRKTFEELVEHGFKTILYHCAMFKQDGFLESPRWKELSNYLTFLKVLSALKCNVWFDGYINELIGCCCLQFPTEIDATLKLEILQLLENYFASSTSLESCKSEKLHNILLKFISFPSMKIIEKSLQCIEMLVSRGILEMLPIKNTFMTMFESLRRQVEDSDRIKNQQNKKYEVAFVSNLQQIKTSLIIVGMFSKFFDPTQLEMERSKIFETFILFVRSEDEDIKFKAMCGLGFFLQRHSELLLDNRLIRIISEITLTSSSSSSSPATVICVLKYLENFFRSNDSKKTSDKQEEKSHMMSLKDMHEDESSSLSQLVQVFLKSLLDNLMISNLNVREISLNIISSILHQGLVHPVMCLAHLICASCGTKDSQNICSRAEFLLREIQFKYPSIIGASIFQGVRLSYRLNTALQAGRITRGYWEVDGKIHSCFEVLYTLVHKNNIQCRNFVKSVLKCFSEGTTLEVSEVDFLMIINSQEILWKCKLSIQDCSVNELLYLADALSCLPFSSLEIVLFLVNDIDLIVSSEGSNLLHDFVQILGLKRKSDKKSRKKGKKCQNRFDVNHDKVGGRTNNEDEIPEVSFTREQIQNAIKNIADDELQRFQDVCSMLHRCLLLIHLKDHLYKQFNINDRNVRNYTMESKSLTRISSRAITSFHPKLTMAFIDFKDDIGRIIDCFLELKNHFEGESN